MTDVKNKLTVRIDLRVIVGVLLVVITAMLAVWMPWKAANNNDQTIRVTGDTTIKAEPDEYMFSPNYQFKNASKDQAIATATDKSNQIVAQLKALDVPESKIKTEINGYSEQQYPENTSDDYVYSLQLTITLDTKVAAETIQAYLLTTEPQGGVSPQATLSTVKRKEIEVRAREQAAQDAKAKADQSAENLGFSVGRVKSVEDGSGFGQVYPVSHDAIKTNQTSVSSLPSDGGGATVLSGENDIYYSITVTYFVK